MGRLGAEVIHTQVSSSAVTLCLTPESFWSVFCSSSLSCVRNKDLGKDWVRIWTITVATLFVCVFS